MRIQYFGGEAWEREYIREKLAGEEIVFNEGSFSAYGSLTDPGTQVLCVFMDSPIGEAELRRFPALKLIATRSTGFDHIDLAATAKRDIKVATVPHYGENTVAEFTFALLLALSRKIPEARAAVRRAGTFEQGGLRGFDLSGKTFGVVGTGRIGAHAVRMAQGFGMHVVAFDTYPNTELSHTLNFPYMPLEELLRQSDIISLHVPYNQETHHLLNASNIGSIKRGAYLINTARGAVVETAALLNALEDGIIVGAGLDVLEDESKLADPRDPTTTANRELIAHPGVIVTPHVAFDTTEAIKRILDTTVENIMSFKSGTPQNLVAS